MKKRINWFFRSLVQIYNKMHQLATTLYVTKSKTCFPLLIMAKDPYPFDQLPQLALQQQQVLVDAQALYKNEAFSLKKLTFQERSLLYAILKQSEKANNDLLKDFSVEETAESERWEPFVALLTEEVPLKHLVTCHEEQLKTPEEWENWSLYLIDRLRHNNDVIVAAEAARNPTEEAAHEVDAPTPVNSEKVSP